MLRYDLDYDNNDEAAVWRYLDAGFSDIVDRMEQLDQFSVGDGYQVEFTEEVVLKHNIGSFGRMTRNNGENVYHAGPNRIDTSLRYEITYPGHMAEFEKWSQNEQVIFEFPDVYEMPKKVKPMSTPSMHKIETDTLKLAASFAGQLHLVHPSEGAMYRCEHLDVTATVHPSRFNEMKAIVDKLNKKLSFLDNGDPKVLHYLGSNGVPEGDLPNRWFALVPNPFQEKFPFDPHSLVQVKDGVAVQYFRNGFQQQFMLPSLPPYHLIPPEAIAAKFACVTDGFFLATNEANFAQLFDVLTVRDSPIIGYIGEYPAYDENGRSIRDGVLYDVKGCGTYASRYRMVQYVASCLGLTAVTLSSIPMAYEVNYYDPIPRELTVVHTRDLITSYVGPVVSAYSYTKKYRDSCVIYGPLMENGSHFKDFIGNYVQVPCHYGPVTTFVAIPPHFKRPLYVFRNYKHMVMSQFELCNVMIGRGFKPESRYGLMGRTQKMPTSRLLDKVAEIVLECPIADDYGHLGVSDDEIGLKLGISPAQAESLMVNYRDCFYLGQWLRGYRKCGYWIHKTRFTETRSNKLVSAYFSEWVNNSEVEVDMAHSEYFQWFFYHQGKPVVSIRPINSREGSIHIKRLLFCGHSPGGRYVDARPEHDPNIGIRMIRGDLVKEHPDPSLRVGGHFDPSLEWLALYGLEDIV